MAVETTSKLTPEQLKFYGESQYQLLEKSYGAKLDEKLKAAGRKIQELEKKQPGLSELLKSKGIGDNAPRGLDADRTVGSVLGATAHLTRGSATRAGNPCPGRIKTAVDILSHDLSSTDVVGSTATAIR
jgi:hypothetical protein